MLFNELIDENSVEKVSLVTNISIANLEYLQNEDFKKMNRVKALGFLLILEREYPNIDVAPLREKIKLFFEVNEPEDDHVVMVAKESTTGEGISFFKLFVILGLLGGALYLYNQGKLDGLMKTFDSEDKKDFFDDNKALENNISEEDAKRVVVETTGDETVRIISPVAPKVEEPIILTENIDVNSSATTAVTNADPKSTEIVVEEVSQEFLSTAESTLTTSETVVVEKVITPITTISINPTRGMLWFGFINLDTKKRIEFMKNVSTPFDIKSGKWLLVTGHGYVDIVSDNKTVENGDSKKHYFYIDSTDIRELNKKEFRKMNGRRGW